MSDQDIVNTETQTTETKTDPLNDLLSSIVTEQGTPKYASVEDALTGTKHQLDHITKLERENATLREEQSKMEDFIKSLSDQETTTTTAQATEETVTTATPETTATEQPDTLNEDTIIEKLRAKMLSDEAEKNKATNRQAVVDSLKAKYGDKASEFITTKASELGMSTDFLFDVAATSPTAFYNTVGMTVPKVTGRDFSSSVNTAALSDDAPNKYEGKNPLLSGRSKDSLALWNSL